MPISRRFVLFAIAALIVSMTFGCKRGGDNDASLADTLSVADSIIEVDAMPTDTVDPKKIPARRFYSADSVRMFMAESEDSAKYREGIIPGIVDVSVEYADRLLNSTHDYFIVVDKKTLNLGLYDKYGRLQKAYQFACAKNYGNKHEKRDGRTPEGFFVVQGKYDSSEWLFTDDDGNTSEIRGQYGPRFLRVRPMIGIHGTMSTWSLGHRASHGCIRLDNRAICQLFDMVDVGTPIIISPGTRDQRVNNEEGTPTPMIVTGLTGDSYKNYELPDVPEEIMEKLQKALDKNPKPKPKSASDSTSTNNSKRDSI